jgi:hypothetical protein
MKAEEAQSLVQSGLERLMADPKEWGEWARTFSRFTKYSPGNILLIMSQRQDATYVAGYRTWQSLGRQVEKGQKAITILAPVIKKVESDEKSDEQSGKKLVAFRTASVFDVAQTSGEPLKIPEPVPLEGSRMGEALQHLIPVVGHPVRFGDTGEAFGVWSPSEGTITIRQDVPKDHQLKTLLHEWSHSIGVPSADVTAERHRGVEEIIAETTAFVVAGSLGLDTAEYSKGYVAGWASGDLKVVAAATHEIGSRVHQIIGVIEKAAERDPVLKRLTAAWQPIQPHQPEPAVEKAAVARAR